MTRSSRPARALLRRLALPLIAAATLLAGCGAMEVKKEAIEKTDAARAGPERAPFRSITGFSGALRCMDNLMIDYGVRDLSMLVEEILDQTKKVNAGTRDMMITAMSEMTRRSRAVRVVAFGKDATNAISFLQSAQRLNVYQAIPQYDIKGSVSQFDENVIRNQKDFGIGYSPFINLGIARDAASSILGLDLSVLTTDDLSILAGVTSRNSVVILKSGKGLDGDAAYHKFGVNYSMTLSKSEAQSQALRGLVELAVVELMGKLTKTPYWSCLGGKPDASEEIRAEISDWYFAMASRPAEIIVYFQNQLRNRGFYRGPIDGRFNPAIDEAMGNYRAALGLSKKAVIDEAFFVAFLKADHSKIKAPAQPAVAEVAPGTAHPGAAATPAAEAPELTLFLTTDSERSRYARGEQINLHVRTNRDAYVYCYLQDERQRITRFFPNRFAKDALVAPARPLDLPGNMRFLIVMNGKGLPETVACFAVTRNVLAELPAHVTGTDFEPLQVVALQELHDAFSKAAGRGFTHRDLLVQPK
jgi:hypothetical protein